MEMLSLVHFIIFLTKKPNFGVNSLRSSPNNFGHQWKKKTIIHLNNASLRNTQSKLNDIIIWLFTNFRASELIHYNSNLFKVAFLCRRVCLFTSQVLMSSRV